MAVRQRGADARFIVVANAAESESVDLYNCRIVGLKMPHTWTAASLAFKRALDDHNSVSDRTNAADTDYAFVKDQGGNVVVIAGGADDEIVFDQDTCAKLRGLRHIKLVSWDAGAGAVINQGADTTVIPLVECC